MIFSDKISFNFILFLIFAFLTSNLVKSTPKIRICSIELNGIKNNDKVCNPVNIIRGKITCQLEILIIYPNNLTRNITSKVLNIAHSWPINKYNEFKAIVNLKKGLNNISLSYVYQNEKASLEFALNYEENINQEPLRLCIFVAKDSPLKFDMDKESLLLGDKNNLDSAIKRVQTAGLLYQALTSDSLNYNGYGRKTFRLELDENYLPKINIIKSNLTRAQLIKLYLNDLNLSFKSYELWDHICRSVKTSQLYQNATKLGKKKMVFGVMILDSYYDKNLKRAVLHNAYGSIDLDLDVGIGAFGSHLLHAWPESLNQTYRFFDERKLDFNQLTDDFSPNKLEALNVGMGAFLHEIGHAHGLDHSGEGIMDRDWFFNKFLFSVYKKDGLFNPVRHFIDEDKTGWKNTDAQKLADHGCIKNSFITNTGKWKATGENKIFIKIDEKVWNEMYNGKLAYQFNFVSESGQIVILYTVERKFYISLDQKFAKWGMSTTDINNIFNNGTWITN